MCRLEDKILGTLKREHATETQNGPGSLLELLVSKCQTPMDTLTGEKVGNYTMHENLQIQRAARRLRLLYLFLRQGKGPAGDFRGVVHDI